MYPDARNNELVVLPSSGKSTFPLKKKKKPSAVSLLKEMGGGKEEDKFNFVPSSFLEKKKVNVLLPSQRHGWGGSSGGSGVWCDTILYDMTRRGVVCVLRRGAVR